jgi:1-acyl-sn-glycerol-3-phosphate acyltransferase
MAQSGAPTAAQARNGHSPNGGDPTARRGREPEGMSARQLAEEVAGSVISRVVRPLSRFTRPVVNQLEDRMTADLDARDPDFIREQLPTAWLASSLWFRGEVRGLERLPEEGPLLLVGNHSGGNMTPDTIVFTLSFNTYFGVERPFYQLAHNLVLASPYGMYLRKFGTVAASHENARRALEAGAAVLVYPGGDHEVHRPSTERNRVDFDGRKGFVRLALEAGVPIVPVVSVGGQETALFLSDGRRLARALRLDRLFRLKVLPVSLALPWILNVGDFLGHLPLPAKITTQVLEPIDLRERFGPDPDHDDVYEHVTDLMQETLDGLAAERRFPVLG